MITSHSQNPPWYLYYGKAGVRLFLIFYLMFSLPWDCIVCITCLAASYYRFFSDPEENYVNMKELFNGFQMPVNPFKGKVGQGSLNKDEIQTIQERVSQMVLYDAANTQSVRNFETIKQNSECAFAKRAKLWGSPEYDEKRSLEENIRRLGPTFYKFTLAFQSLALDAFLIELPGPLYCGNIKVFGDAVRRVLYTLREIDLERIHDEIRADKTLSESAIQERLKLYVEDPKSWHRLRWVFEFNKKTFFITTFAPFYPETNSRFSFGSKHGYILFQPEISFAIHDLPPDSPNTNWLCPKNVRDRIRIAFREAGREYDPPLKVGEPMVCEIVKRVEPDDTLIEWWLPSETDNNAKE